MPFSDMEIKSFSASLASPAAVPGGGGASALAASLGAALAAMVGGLTVGKAKYAEYADEISSAIGQAKDLSDRLNRLIDADAEAFSPLAEIYAMPKDFPGRRELLEQALKKAAQVPLEILRCACRGIELHAQLENKCSVLAVSDVATGVALCRSALFGAAVNVRVNTRLMSDKACASALDTETEILMEKYVKTADGVYARIWEKLK